MSNSSVLSKRIPDILFLLGWKLCFIIRKTEESAQLLNSLAQLFVNFKLLSQATYNDSLADITTKD